MQPQQPYQQPPQYPPQPPQAPQGGGSNEFDFIMNPSTPPKKPVFSFGGGPKVSRIILILAAVFIVAIIGAVLLSSTKNSGFDKAAMIGIAQDQSELLRLTEVGSSNAKSQTLVNFNATTSLTTLSDQTELLKYMGTNGVKVKTKDLAIKVDSTTDTQLSTAISSGTFDTVYKSVMDKKLSEYQADLAAAYKNAGAKGKALLKTQYNNAKLLRAQLNS